MKAAGDFKKIIKLLPAGIRKKLPRKVNIVAVNKKVSGALNYRYRGKRRPTNVLSFRYDPGQGEIVICPDVIRREAKAQKNSYQYQKAWMIAHGLLHLTGIHHEKSGRARKKFEQIEQKLLEKLGN